MLASYEIVFLDCLAPDVLKSASLQVRAIQRDLSIPIYQKLGVEHKQGALRSNALDDICEFLGKRFTNLGRTVVAIDGHEVVGFFKAPIRLPTFLCRMIGSHLANGSVRAAARNAFSIPSIEIWCVNSMGIKKSYQGKGLPRKLISLAITQFNRPIILLTGHEGQNLASKHLHIKNGFAEPYYIRIFHLTWYVYCKVISMSN